MIVLKIKGKDRVFSVGKIASPEKLRSDLLARGWDGICYTLTGKKGSFHLAYKSAQTGVFEIVQ